MKQLLSCVFKKNLLFFILTAILALLVAAVFVSLCLKPYGVVFQGLSQIVGGYVGGYIALVGVVVTLKKQKEISDKAWTQQLELSREEWRRQDSRNREELRINAMPWLEIARNDLNARLLYVRIEDPNAIFTNSNSNENHSVTYDRFAITNTGKDAAFLHHIKVSCPRGSAYLKPESTVRITLSTFIQIDAQVEALVLNNQEPHSLSLIYSDIFGNYYSANIDSRINSHGLAYALLDDGTRHAVHMRTVVRIENPVQLPDML